MNKDLKHPDLVDLFLDQFCYTRLADGPFFVVIERVIKPQEVDEFISTILDEKEKSTSNE